MKPEPMIGRRTHEKAGLLLAFSKALPAKMRSRTREVLEVYTFGAFRGLGLATKLLEETCEEADRHRLMLIVFPKPYSQVPSEPNVPGETRLISWYVNNFGFEIVQTKPVVMLARPPISAQMFAKIRDDSNLLIESIK